MMPANEPLYLYALAGQGPPRRFTVLGHRLRRLPLGDVSAIVERRAMPDVTTEAVCRQHAIVTELALREAAILPARFGSATDEPSLRSLVSIRRKDILGALQQVRGRAQMTIRILGVPAPPLEKPSPAGSGTEFLQQRRQRAHHVPDEVTIVRRELGSLVESERVASGERDGLVTVFHLVPQHDLDDYRQRASRLHAALQPRTVAVTGPWPPFAFAPELF